MAKLRIIQNHNEKTNHVLSFKENRYIRRFRLFKRLFIATLFVAILEAIYIGLHYGNR